jgi:CheY-like chemotaxis protein
VHAYSGAEAKQVLARESGIALVFLDVVMEREDSGLEVARWMREDLDNQFTRIVLRTGQPGQAPEERVIVNYDINDYKEKTELDRTKLFTTTFAALRAYRDIMKVEEARRPSCITAKAWSASSPPRPTSSSSATCATSPAACCSRWSPCCAGNEHAAAPARRQRHFRRARL